MSKLVMIDDSPLEHLVMQKMLSRYDLFEDAAHATNGKVIIDLLRENLLNTENLPDLIFLDLHMPEFSGWDFMEEFEMLYPSFKKPISIYVISSSLNQADRSSALAYPFVKAFYQKPIKRVELESLYMDYRNTGRIAG